jgi:hypothetical protein
MLMQGLVVGTAGGTVNSSLTFRPKARGCANFK